jgi:hypothetical protein
MNFSRRAIAKLVQVFDHIMQRNDKMSNLFLKSSSVHHTKNESMECDDGGAEEENNGLLIIYGNK